MNETIDLTYVYDIANGNQAFVLKLLGILQKNLRDFPIQMTQEFEKKDWHSLRETAHKFKSCTAYTGVENFNHTLKEIEISAEENRLPEEIHKLLLLINEYSLVLNTQVSQIIEQMNAEK
ncbi:MAG: Hpt domain-containing protein [Bacteroidetes bacterium]|nr:MAG: Hpt domain-containing protein [Bacteroidota bacterium]